MQICWRAWLLAIADHGNTSVMVLCTSPKQKTNQAKQGSNKTTDAIALADVCVKWSIICVVRACSSGVRQHLALSVECGI
jgi:hypothetical protein